MIMNERSAPMDPLVGTRTENSAHMHHRSEHHLTYMGSSSSRGDLLAVEIHPDAPSEAPVATGTSKGKRLCRFPGCIRVIKSQGHCQRHGAKTKRCRVDGCEKQAQGTHDGMCKRHWKAINFPEEATIDEQPPPPEGESVYDTVIPASIAFRPGTATQRSKASSILTNSSHVNQPLSQDGPWANGTNTSVVVPGGVQREDPRHWMGPSTNSTAHDPLEPPRPPPGACVMPLVTFLMHERHREPGWHRNAERRARGMFLVSNLSQQLEPWERQLALVEILLLSGGTPYANFKDLAHAWGREKGFHLALVHSVCERRGEVERKRRSDAGKVLSEQAKASFRKKLRQTRTGRSESGDDQSDLHMDHQQLDLVEEAFAHVHHPQEPEQQSHMEHDQYHPQSEEEMNAHAQQLVEHYNQHDPVAL